MKKYIFFTSDGLTKDSRLNDIDNCQILDWQDGLDENDAHNNFRKNNSDMKLKNICCQELVNNKIFYFD